MTSTLLEEGSPRPTRAWRPRRSAARALERRGARLRALASRWKREGVLEHDPLRCGDRCRERLQEGRSASVDFPSQQHRVVFVRGVVTVLHEHATPVAELHGDRERASRAQAIHVLSATFPGRNVRETSIARKDLPLFEMDVDGMVPAAAAVHEVPDFPRAEFRRRLDAAEVRLEYAAPVSRDAPRPDEGRHRIGVRLTGAPGELKRALASDTNLREIRIRDQ